MSISTGNFWIYTAQSPIISRSRDRQYLPTVSLLLSCTPTYEQCNTRLGGDPIGVLVFAETSLCGWMELRRYAKKATKIEQQICNFLNSYFLVLSVREAFCWKMHGTVMAKIIANYIYCQNFTNSHLIAVNKPKRFPENSTQSSTFNDGCSLKNPFAVMIYCKHDTQLDTTFRQCSRGILAHFSWPVTLSSLIFLIFRSATTFFKSYLTFSMGFKFKLFKLTVAVTLVSSGTSSGWRSASSYILSRRHFPPHPRLLQFQLLSLRI